MQQFFIRIKHKISYCLSANFVIIGLVCFLFLFSNSALSQKSKGQLEINQFVRFDWYPKFQYSINSVNSNSVKIQGTSWGIDAFYKFLVKKRVYIKTGLGYYKHSFNKINQVNSLLGKSKTRIIEDYVPPAGPAPSITYTTSKYWYNTVAFRAGCEIRKDYSNGIILNYGIGAGIYYTFSQNYFIEYPEPDYKTTVGRFFGGTTYGHISIQKRIQNFSFGPSIHLPVYDLWKKDDVFPKESNNETRNKWFNGLAVGIGLTCYF